MDACSFCHRPAEQGVWLRRWPLSTGREARRRVEDVRVALCALHLRACVLEARWQRHDGWEYG